MRAPEPAGLLECGAHSLKFHSDDARRIEEVPCPLGHEVFSSGRISRDTIDRVIRTIEARPRRPRLCIATSAVREAENRDEFVAEITRNLGLEVRILSEWEEASLLAKAYLKANPGRTPALVADLGGGSLEVVHISPKGHVLWNSMPLGAVRLYQARVNGGAGDAEKVLQCARNILPKVVLPKIVAIHVTGGTMKAVSKVLQKTTVTSEELEELGQHVVRHGPPAGLKPARARVFLPGVLILKTLVDFTGAETVSYVEGVSIGRTFLDSRGTGQLGKLLVSSRLLTGEIDPRPATEPAKVVVLRAGVGGGVGARDAASQAN